MRYRNPTIVCHGEVSVDSQGYVRKSFVAAIGAADIQLLVPLRRRMVEVSIDGYIVIEGAVSILASDLICPDVSAQ